MKLQDQLSAELDDLLFAMQQKNLVYNHNFLYFSNKVTDTAVTYNHPDGWIYNDAGSGGQIGYDPASGSCLIKTSSGSKEMTFSQNINEFPRWGDLLKGQKVSACAVIENPGTADLSLTFSLDDGQDISSKTVVVNAKETTKISVELLVNLKATKLEVAITSTASDVVIYVNKVFANVGAVALDTLSCIVQGIIGQRRQYMSTENPPAEELSLCEASKELSGSYTRLNSFLNGKFGTGANDNSLLPDMRGYFSRAWDNGAGVDPDAANRTALGKGSVKGDNVSTVEEDQFKEHVHQLKFDTSGKVTAGTAAAVTVINPALTSDTQKTGGNETRGKNIAELYTMKWA